VWTYPVVADLDVVELRGEAVGTVELLLGDGLELSYLGAGACLHLLHLLIT